MRARVVNMGCRVNRYDGAAIAAGLAARGFEVVTDGDGDGDGDGAPCDLTVLNSCTVTAAADAEGRRLLARAEGLRVVTGCAVRAGADWTRAADAVVAKEDLVALGDTAPALAVDGRSSRFFYKVQEGCDVRCTFCIIPDARGPARSTPPDAVLATLRRARAAGFDEFVLAGIHLGGWGRDLPAPAPSLAALCRRVLDETGVPRVRLGSLEPWGVRPDLAALFRDEPRLMPFLHLPLQSGSDRVLRAMRRPISAAGYLRAVARVLDARPETAVFADVIAGFPGETDADFGATVALLERFPWAKLHVFPYSERPGTPAAALDLPRVPQETKRARARHLLDWSAARFRERLAARAGSDDEIIVEAGGRGHTRDNLPVRLAGPPPPRRALARVRLGALEDSAAGPALTATLRAE